MFYCFYIATVCDQGATNVSAIKTLTNEKSGRSKKDLEDGGMKLYYNYAKL